MCPDYFKVSSGTDQPSTQLFDFENPEPVQNFCNYNTEVTAMRIYGNQSRNVLVGTHGGSISNWDSAANKTVSKLNGHLTSCSAL